MDDGCPANDFLDAVVLEYLRDCGQRGEWFTKFYVQTMGCAVSVEQLRASIWRVDPIGRFARRPSVTTERRVYNVKGAMHLVHVDGTCAYTHMPPSTPSHHFFFLPFCRQPQAIQLRFRDPRRDPRRLLAVHLVSQDEHR